jgi:hypothetical protein
MAFAEKTYAFAALNEILPQPSLIFTRAGFIELISVRARAPGTFGKSYSVRLGRSGDAGRDNNPSQAKDGLDWVTDLASFTVLLPSTY